MPANSCFHIYNRGVEDRDIFADPADYQAFLNFLEDYLTPTHEREVVKKEFTVNGRVFKGVPHQPKNYFGKVELAAYSLKPSHFHLLLREKTKGAMENFLRSLLTRYSIYFNKKYSRSGALFGGRYKSAEVKDVASVSLLTRYFHKEGTHQSEHPYGGQSSYPEYLGERETAWVKAEIEEDYKDFVEKHELDREEQELLARIVLENPKQTSQGGMHQSVHPYGVHQEPQPSRFRMPEFITATAAFVVLVFLGFTNVRSVNQTVLGAASDLPLATAVAIPSPSLSAVIDQPAGKDEIEKPKQMIVVEVDDESTKVNIREKPDTNESTKIIGKAKNGDEFEYVAEDSGWYEVKLDDSARGFIAAEYVQEGEDD